MNPVLTRQELSLLLYFETCAVDGGGRVDSAKVSADDHEVARLWNETGFVSFGRVCSRDVRDRNGRANKSLWCRLSPAAWDAAHAERRARAARMWARRDWETTAEFRGDTDEVKP